MNGLTRRDAVLGAASLASLTLIDGPREAKSADGELPMIVLAPPGGATHLPLLIKAKEFDKQAGVNVQLKPRNELAAYFNDFAAKVEPVHQGGAASVFGNMRVRGVRIVLTHSSCILQILLIIPSDSPIKSTADLGANGSPSIGPASTMAGCDAWQSSQALTSRRMSFWCLQAYRQLRRYWCAGT